MEEVKKNEERITIALLGATTPVWACTFLYLMYRRYRLFNKYQTTDIFEIVEQLPLFGEIPYELTTQCSDLIFMSGLMSIVNLILIICLLVCNFMLKNKKQNRKHE